MKKFLFVGEYQGNTGPANVNLGIKNNLTERFTYVKSSNKYLKVVEIVLKVLGSKVVVVSGISVHGFAAIRFARFFRKKTIYIMHGCQEYETRINNLSGRKKEINMEKYILSKVSLILAVSRKYSEWVGENYPQYKEKIAFVNNGVMPPEKVKQKQILREKNKIAVFGGDRPIKNNIVVSEAIESTNGQLGLYSYGRVYNTSSISRFKWTKYVGLIPQEKFWDELSTCSVFVLNSIVEPFGLTVFDALNCGCSILLAKNVGAAELLKLRETDIIYNSDDKEEIKKKILYLLDNPNNERILAELNYEELSFSKSVQKIQEYCEMLLK